MNSANILGVLFLIGGAAEHSLERFVELSGGKQACIVILPHASSVPVETAEKLSKTFLKLGVHSCITILPGEKTALPKEATAVYFTGGDQSVLVKEIDSDLLDQVRQFLKNGGVVGGTSAGAAVAATTMIAGGMEDGLLRSGSLLLEKGFGFLPGCIIDTHVKQRERTDRLMAAVSLVDGVIGIGLDEDTAVEIKGGVVRAFGEGHVRIYRRSASHATTLKVGEDKRASVYDMTVSVLSAGGEVKL